MDSGCAKTAISNKFFETLNKLQPSITLTDNKGINIQTADGQKHGIKGTTDITIYIGPNKNIPISLNVLVIPVLADALIIGSDILSSDLVVQTTPKEITITNGNYTDVIQIESSIMPVTQILMSNSMTILPNETKTFTTVINGFHSQLHSLKVIETLPDFAISHTVDKNEITFEITNKREYPKTICTNKNIVKVSKVDILKEFPLDDYMNDEEKVRAMNDAKINNYYQPSVTKYIENRNMVTEADKIDIPIILSNDDFIDLFDFSKLTPENRDKIVTIVLENRDAFSLHKYDLGKTNVLEMDIELTSTDNKIQKYIPIPMNVKDRANEILDQMEKFDIIRECHEPSPYCSNILVIPKKDKINVRLLFDGRILNYDTKRLPISFLSKPEILANLMKKEHLTSLDFADAFYQIPLTKKAQPYTAFWTPNQGKRMCFNRAPQGLRNSPLYLKMILDKIFYDMHDSVIFYVDDLLIATNGSIDHHFETINQVLIRLRRANMKLRPQKILIARETIEFLGMIFTKSDINIPKSKLEAFTKIPVPNTPKKLKSALCAFSYYRHFIPHFAHITRDLMEMTNLQPKNFKITPEYEAKYKNVITQICANSSTNHPDNDKPLYVQTDASMYCAGGRIFQKDDEGNEKLIAAVSRTFTKTERNYTIYKKEALALLYTLRSMDYFIQFAKHLIILVDSKALTYIRLAKESKDILLRFSLELSKYEADIIHVPGVQNEISDLLSRQHKDIPSLEEESITKKTLSEKDSLKIVEALTLPDNFTLTKSQLFNLLNGPSPKDDEVKDVSKRTKAKEGPKYVKNTPLTLNSRKIKMPTITKNPKRPGVLLDVKAITRGQTRAQSTPEKQENLSESKVKAADNNSEKQSSTLEKVDSNTQKASSSIPIKEKPQKAIKKTTKRKTTSTTNDISSTLAEAGSSTSKRTTSSKINSDVTLSGETGTQDPIIPPNESENADSGHASTTGPISNENRLEYNDVATAITITHKGFLTKKEFLKIQKLDPFITSQIDAKNPRLIIIDNLYHWKDNPPKIILPAKLTPMLTHTLHYIQPGTHKSKQQIIRDITDQYYICPKTLKKIVEAEINDCMICQIYDQRSQAISMETLKRYNSPRMSWSIDLVTDLPTSSQDNKILLLCVDDFSNYVLAIPLKTSTSEDIIKALKLHLIQPFGIPKFLRSDEQPGIYNSKEFYDFMQKMKIDLIATAVASPFSNGRAERTIKTFKEAARKYFFQNKTILDWDDELAIITNVINTSINSYNHSPEEIMFGTKNESNTHLIDLAFYNNDSHKNDNTIKLLLEKAHEQRQKYEHQKSLKEKSNKTFKNQKSINKSFEVGDLVFHRQLQVSTGTAGKWAPINTGPYVIDEINPSEHTAQCTNLATKQPMKTHLTNLTKYNHESRTLRLPGGQVNLT